MRATKYLLLALFVLTVISTGQWVVSAFQQIEFVRDIQPIFESQCVACHGAKKAAGQLRLDGKASALKGGISGSSIVPGNSKASLLLTRILGEGGQAQMPMGGDPLKPEQIELIRQWIDAGAVWVEKSEVGTLKSEEGPAIHWAYKKPVRPTVPVVKNKAWGRNPIDAFILARLEKEGLQPAPEASKETLLRRVYLDLIGLPPSVKELDAFLADNSANAYEKVVDQLLASRHFGERWARPWLDLARYADSNGYEKDNLRVMWKYRDWVINAFNQNMPFDQFTIEQLAGDMLPKPSDETRAKEQLIATGFHRNTLINQEGGIDPEEARFEILVDRVNTTATVWLGSTMGCAQCHNHKYDPFSQKDYYKLYAFFNSAQYEYGYQGGGEETRWVKEPILDLPSPEQEARRKVLEAEIKQIETKLKTQTPELDSAQSLWEKEMLAESKRWVVLEPQEIKSLNGAVLTKQSDSSVLASGPNPEAEIYTITTSTSLKNITALRLEALTDESLPKGGPGRDPYGNFLLTGIEVEAAPANNRAKAQTISFKTATVDNQTGRIEPKKFFTKEGDSLPIDKPSGWQINATSDITRVNRNAVFAAEKPFSFIGGTTLTIKLKHLAGAVGQGIGRFRLSVITSTDPSKITKISAALKPVLATPANQRTAKQQQDLASLHRAQTPLLKADRDRLEGLQKSLKDLGIVTALIVGENPGYERPSAPFRNRGSFLSPGEKVFADVPAFLPRMPENLPYNRLGLAKWLVSDENPLTARVAVNRFWEAIFGRGLVLTAEDFGTQGEAPSHPELLDWLAVEFRNGTESGSDLASGANPLATARGTVPERWNIKALLKTIVMSATYRQDSTVTPVLQEKDPYNRLLARGPRFRLEAEAVRDLGLTVSGLLSSKIGGPSVFPLQPEGIWKSPYSSEKWTTSEGEDRYRRSLYTFIRRTAPFPQMMTFDGTSRETCIVRRVRTNTPLQALTLLNDEGAMENARALAARMLQEGGASLAEQLTYGFRSCLTRKPEPKELERLTALYKQQLRNFTAQSAQADKVWKLTTDTKKPEKAALTMVANVLLNLDETVTKE